MVVELGKLYMGGVGKSGLVMNVLVEHLWSVAMLYNSNINRNHTNADME